MSARDLSVAVIASIHCSNFMCKEIRFLQIVIVSLVTVFLEIEDSNTSLMTVSVVVEVVTEVVVVVAVDVTVVVISSPVSEIKSSQDTSC